MVRISTSTFPQKTVQKIQLTPFEYSHGRWQSRGVLGYVAVGSRVQWRAVRLLAPRGSCSRVCAASRSSSSASGRPSVAHFVAVDHRCRRLPVPGGVKLCQVTARPYSCVFLLQRNRVKTKQNGN